MGSCGCIATLESVVCVAPGSILVNLHIHRVFMFGLIFLKREGEVCECAWEKKGEGVK